jgi:hypothetical protein
MMSLRCNMMLQQGEFTLQQDEFLRCNKMLQQDEFTLQHDAATR